jgi:hypothetical protein
MTSLQQVINYSISQFIKQISLHYNISENELQILWDNKYIDNRGMGAGGSNTNKNGLSYEEKTDLSTEYKIIERLNCENCIFLQFNNSEKIYSRISKEHIFTCISGIDKSIKSAHGCKKPDECYIDSIRKIIFIIEKKFQQVSGSVCEKIQTGHFKLYHYRKTFPTYKIVYIYCLSDWFKDNCKAELEYLKYINIPVFWGNDIDYKSKIINFITNFN